MEQPINRGDGFEAREEAAKGALAEFRERRRRRRGEDTYYGSLDAMLQRAEEGLGEVELERRRVEILEDAEESGISRELAEKLYEVAREEGLDPALALELVRSGLGVAPPPEGISNAPSEPTSDRYMPEWIFPAVPPDDLLRERMLRFSFRRLLKLLDEHEELDEAFRAFAREPDVGHFGY